MAFFIFILCRNINRLKLINRLNLFKQHFSLYILHFKVYFYYKDPVIFSGFHMAHFL